VPYNIYIIIIIIPVQRLARSKVMLVEDVYIIKLTATTSTKSVPYLIMRPFF